MMPPPNSESDETRTAEDRRLQELLRENAPDYIDDAGFTAAVIGRLPAPRAARQRRRLWLVGGALALGTAAAAVLAGPAVAELGALAAHRLADWNARPIPYVGDWVSLGALVVCLVGAALAWRVLVRGH